MATAASSPRAVLLRGDDNVAVAARPIPGGFLLELDDVAVEFASPSSWATRYRCGRLPRANRSGNMARSSGLPHETLPPVLTCTCTT